MLPNGDNMRDIAGSKQQGTKLVMDCVNLKDAQVEPSVKPHEDKVAVGEHAEEAIFSKSIGVGVGLQSLEWEYSKPVETAEPTTDSAVLSKSVGIAVENKDPDDDEIELRKAHSSILDTYLGDTPRHLNGSSAEEELVTFIAELRDAINEAKQDECLVEMLEVKLSEILKHLEEVLEKKKIKSQIWLKKKEDDMKTLDEEKELEKELSHMLLNQYRSQLQEVKLLPSPQNFKEVYSTVEELKELGHSKRECLSLERDINNFRMLLTEMKFKEEFIVADDWGFPDDLQCEMGDLVKIPKGAGVVRYVNSVYTNNRGQFVGVELDTPTGNCDGKLGNIRYFKTRRKCAVFVPQAKIDVVLPASGVESDYYILKLLREKSPEQLKCLMLCLSPDVKFVNLDPGSIRFLGPIHVSLKSVAMKAAEIWRCGRSTLVIDPNEIVQDFYRARGSPTIDMQKHVTNHVLSSVRIELEDVMEDMRRNLVSALGQGRPLLIALRTSTPDFRKYFKSREEFPVPAAFIPKLIFSKDTWGSLIRDEDVENKFCQEFVPHKGFHVVVTTSLPPDEYERFLSNKLPELDLFHVLSLVS